MNKFYDIHCHAFTLSHPNILAFVKKINLTLLMMTTPLSAPLMRLIGKTNKIQNLLTMMENDLGNYFLILEYYLRQSHFIQGDLITVGSTNQYKKIVLTPLIMDFGYKNILSDTFYRLPAQKPIIEQIRDLMEAITCYNMFKLEVTPDVGNRVFCDHVAADKSSKLFEIYPFIGINTKNYRLAEIEKILIEYFKTGAKNIDSLYADMGTTNGFAGIKIYPPLGFDPWPEDINEQEKARFLYQFCSDKRIPMTAHCSDGGFVIVDDANNFTCPDKWVEVLKSYPLLKLNLAHMGLQSNKRLWLFQRTVWRDVVLKLVNDYEYVYTDFSCAAFNDDYYNYLAGTIAAQSNIAHLKERILFGSDFMINLLWSPSYNQYVEDWCRTEHISPADKNLICSINPERFLFK